MNKEMLKKMAEQLSKKVEEAFAKFMETAKTEDVQAYNNLVEQLNKLNDQLAAIEAEELKKQGRKPAETEADGKKQKYTKESRDWAKKVLEAVAVGGNYTALVPSEIATGVIEKLNDYGRIVSRVTKHTLSGSYKFAVEGSEASFDYVTEGGSVSDSTPTLTPVTLDAYAFAGLVKLSKEAVNDPAVDFIDWIINALAKAAAKKLDGEILSGTGSGNSHITGILTALNAETLTPHIVTDTTALGAFTWANLKAVMSKLGEYRDGAVLIMKQETADYIHEFKDNGKYIFDQNQPLDAIWGMKVVICSQMPAMGTDGNIPVLAANLSYYHVGMRQDFDAQILSELYAATRQIGVIADMRADGKPALTDAFAALKTDF